jgi:hypothetical protein
VQFTIERLPLSARSHDPAVDSERVTSIIEAADPEDAISRYVSEERSELMSHARALRGAESVATVRKDDAVYMLRVYPN